MSGEDRGVRSLRLMVAGEVSALLAAMKRSGRWGGSKMEEMRDPLLAGLHQLQQRLLRADDELMLLSVSEVVGPFCEVVSSEDTTGPVTGMAISSLDKLLSAGLIMSSLPSAATGIREVAEAITHARFVGTSTASDEVVLMRILKVLRIVLLVPAGRLLTNEGVCEIMQSCFRICFEERLSELLRCFAEGTLVEMVRLLFSNLSRLKEKEEREEECPSSRVPANNKTGSTNREVEQGDTTLEEEQDTQRTVQTDLPVGDEGVGHKQPADDEEAEGREEEEDGKEEEQDAQFVSSRGVHFTSLEGRGAPHGLSCVKEVLRFLVSITDPRDGGNSSRLIGIGLALVTVALEVGCRQLSKFPSLLGIVSNHLCRHLMMLMHHDNSDLFFAALRNLFLLFEGCRHRLKLQMEWFLVSLMAKLRSDSPRLSAAKKELLIECLIQLLHLPGFVPELYVNYDCSLYCDSLCEKLTKLLSKLVTPTTPGAIQSTHLLSLDALLTMVSSLSVTPSAGHTPSAHTPSGSDTITPSAGVLFSTAEVVSSGLISADGNSTSEPCLTIGNSPVVLHNMANPSELLNARQRKKLITAGTEQFNKSPSAGVVFLQEQGMLQNPLDPVEVATFFRQNPALSKQLLGDFLGARSNAAVLEAFVRNFQFSGVKLVDALREFLESFRLPGEAPVISHIMEMFAAHWLECNAGGLGTVFANKDAVYVLCYAIMMLQTDLHSANLRQRMSLEEFIEARRGMNDGRDFPNRLLSEIYASIKDEEIVLPSERSGVVKEDYEWKVLIHRSSGDDGLFHRIVSCELHRDVFLLCWGPATAALSSALDSWPTSDHLLSKIMDGFRLCAVVAAQHELREVFDNLVISLSKFTSLLHPPDPSSSVAVTLAMDPRARLSLEVLLSLSRQHGSLLREGWKNLLDCLLSLFRARLLPEQMVEVSDFLAERGVISLYANEAPAVRPDSSLLSAFFSYNYWLLSGDSTHHSPILTPSEAKARSATVALLKQCGVHLLFSETKFLPEESLVELVKALVFASRSPEMHHTLGTVFDEESAVFFMELLVTVTLENRDRVAVFLSDVTDHLVAIILSGRPCRRLRERAVVGLVRLAIRLLHKDPVTAVLFRALQALFLIPFSSSTSNPSSSSSPSSSFSPSERMLRRQMAKGLMELTHSQAANITTTHDWTVLCSLLEFAATSRSPSRGGTVGTDPSHHHVTEVGVVTESERPDLESALVMEELPERGGSVQRQALNRFDLLVEDSLPPQDPEAFFITCESLCYLVRDEGCPTVNNFTAIVRTVRLFTEVAGSRTALEYDRGKKKDGEQTYASAALKLLDLLDTLYSRAQAVFSDEDALNQLSGGGGGGGGGLLWHMCRCPLLEGMARMCCDLRRGVRQTAIAYFQRALLAYNLHSLTAHDWEACFLEVLFPMLTRLIEEGGTLAMEESRMRACNLLCKLFLQHLPQLAALATFPDLWLGILDFMDKYMHIDGSELLAEAVPESLKNMLLVMVTQGVLDVRPVSSSPVKTSRLWAVTWQRLEQFLPGFLVELFPQIAPSSPSPSPPPVKQQPLPLAAVVASPVLEDSSCSSSSPRCQEKEEEEEGEEEEGAKEGKEGEHKGAVTSFPIVIHPPLPNLGVSPSSSSSSSPPSSPPSSAVMGTE